MEGVIHSCMCIVCTSNDNGQCTSSISVSEEGKCNAFDTQCYADCEKSCPINLIEKGDECAYCSTFFITHIKRLADEARMKPDNPNHIRTLYSWIDEACRVIGGDEK